MTHPKPDFCERCDDEGWVCENHPEKPWDGTSCREDACGCGAGQPCDLCNPCDYHNPPKKTGMKSVLATVYGKMN